MPPGEPSLDGSAVAWLRRENERLFVPSTAMVEIGEGIAKLGRSGATTKADALANWMEALISLYGDRVPAFDLRAARRAGELSDETKAKGRHPGFPDISIAAIADVEGMTVATRNLRHFEAIGVSCLDPFA